MAVLSDRVRLPFRAFEHLAVSMDVAAAAGPATEHAQAHQTSFVTPAGGGNRSASESGDGFSIAITSRFFVTALEVRASRRTGAVVAFGDSITDGDQRSTTFAELGIDADARYPDFLARRLGRRLGRRVGVLNAGIGGNRILRDGLAPFAGPAGLSRVAADVLGQAGVTHVIVPEGINDLGQPPAATAEDVIGGLQMLVARLQGVRVAGRRLRVLVGTLTPASGSVLGSYGSAAVNASRVEVNRFIRQRRPGDGVVDFDAALRDPAAPDRLRADYDSGDHLHPSAAGYRRMAHAVRRRLLRDPRCP